MLNLNFLRDSNYLQIKFCRIIGRGETTKPHNLFSTAYIIEITSFSRVPLYENEIVLQQNYLEKGLTVKEMSVLLGCGSTTIKKQLRRFNIRKIEVQEVRHKSNLKYGQKLISGKIIEHKKETNIQRTIVDMYLNEGLTVTSIARLLTQMKIPTKKRGKRWDHSIIIEILKREGVYNPKRTAKGKKL